MIEQQHLPFGLVLGFFFFLNKRENFSQFCFRMVTLEVFEWSMLSFTSATALVFFRLYTSWVHWCEKRKRSQIAATQQELFIQHVSGSYAPKAALLDPLWASCICSMLARNEHRKFRFIFIRAILLCFCEGKHFM